MDTCVLLPFFLKVKSRGKTLLYWTSFEFKEETKKRNCQVLVVGNAAALGMLWFAVFRTGEPTDLKFTFIIVGIVWVRCALVNPFP